MKLYMSSVIVAVVSFFWSYIYYAGGLYPEDYTRPFVYRQLVPLLARGIEFFGVPAGVALVAVMTVSGVGFYLALRKLTFQFYNLSNKQELYLVVGVLVSMLVMGAYRKPYDLMTACLFTLFFYYMRTEQNAKQLLVFALSCVNRETTVLLVLFYVVYLFYLRKYPQRGYEYIWMFMSQIYLYVLITFAVRFILSDAPGSSLWVQPVENILKFANQPYRFLLHLYGTFALLWWMSRGWEQKPEYLRYAFGLFAPILLIAHLVVGTSFELRIFWELDPLVIILSLPKP